MGRRRLVPLLAGPLGPGHLSQALGGGGGTDRETHHHDRDLVTEPVVVVVVGTDGHEHLQQPSLGRLATRGEEIVHPAGDRGQEQVVQGDPEVVLGVAELVQRVPDGDGAPVEADGNVQRAVGPCGRPRQEAGERPDVVGQQPGRPGRVAQRGEGVDGEPPDRIDPVDHAVDGDHHPPGRWHGPPPVGGVRDRRPGLQVQQDGGELDARQAVRHGVVEHLEEGDAPALEPVDEPDVPQGAAPVEWARHQPRTEVEQLSLVTGLGQRRLVHVCCDVEVGVVHPHRCRLADQGETDALAQLRHQVQPALHLGPDLVEPQASTSVVQRSTLEDPDGSHVHGRVTRLHGEERRVERRQDVTVRGHDEANGSAGRPEQTSANPSSMQPASFGLSGTAATSAVMVMQARSPAEMSETLSAAPDGGDTA